MPIASKPECVEGPRQQLTTRMRLRECLLPANPSVLKAHANNSQQGDRGNAYCQQTRVCWWPTPTTHNKKEIEGMPMPSKPECVDGPCQLLTTRRRLVEWLLQENKSVLMAHANNSQQEGDWGNAYCQQTRVCWWPTPATHNKKEIEGMPIASKPECNDGPRQQLTTRRRLRERILPANPSVLMAHAKNSQQEGKCGNSYCKQTRVCWRPTPTTHNKEIEGMPIASKPECVDGPRQQLTTRRRLRECLLQANLSVLMAHSNNSQQERDWRNAYAQQTRVCWWPMPTTHYKKVIGGMTIASKQECVDGPCQLLTTRRRLVECLLQANKSALMAHANNSQQEGDWGNAYCHQTRVCWWPTPATHNKKEIEGMPFACKPECNDGPRQQLTTRRRLRECVLPPNPSVLMAHASNSQQEGNWGNAYCMQTRVCWWPTPKTHKKESVGIPIASKPECVDGRRQQLTTGRRLRECLLTANPSKPMAHANNSKDRNGIAGMSFAGKSKVVDGQRQQLTTDKEIRGMPNASKPK